MSVNYFLCVLECILAVSITITVPRLNLQVESAPLSVPRESQQQVN